MAKKKIRNFPKITTPNSLSLVTTYLSQPIPSFLLALAEPRESRESTTPKSAFPLRATLEIYKRDFLFLSKGRDSVFSVSRYR